MRTIPLDAAPNQSVSINIGENRWTLRIKEATSSMIADVSLNDQPLLYGIRFCVGTPLIPFRYLAGNGNFLLLVNDEELPDWQQFGVTQQLVYVYPSEISYAQPIDWSYGPLVFEYDFLTYADAFRALQDGILSNNQTISVKVDETQGGLPTRYVVYLAPDQTLVLDFVSDTYQVSSRTDALILMV